MKVLMITPRFDTCSGGDGLYAYILSMQLIQMGVEVSVLTIKEGYFVYKEIKQIDSTNTASNETQWQVLKKVDKGIIGKDYYSRSARKSLIEALALAKPAVIHVHGIHQYFTISAAKILSECGIPVVTTIHDYKILCGNAGFFSDRRQTVCYKCLKGKVTPAIIERCKKGSIILSTGASLQMGIWKILGLNRYSTVFHCPSKFVFDLLKNNSDLIDRLEYIRYPLLQDSAQKKTYINPLTRIIYSGRMVPHKGVLIFAEAVKNLDIDIHIFGDGPELEKARIILQSNNRVVFYGWVERSKLHAYLGPGALVVLPYLAPETFCFAVAEAMLSGACVISTTRGAIPELIKNGLNGILLDDFEPVAIKNVLSELMRDPGKIADLGRSAQKIIYELPSQESHAEAMKNLYKNLIEKYSCSS